MAQDINQVIVVGRLTRDAEVKTTANGQVVSDISIASNRNVKKGDKWESEANFFDVTIWGRQAEALQQYLTKGQQVGITGELRQQRWEKDGQPRSKVIINASHVQLLGSKPQQQTRQQPAQETRPQPVEDTQGEFFEDDIPF
jgi:single-strand DNA-binding protein